MQVPQTERELVEAVASQYTVPAYPEACRSCRRGAVFLPMPSTEQMEALMEIVEEYNSRRRDFSPRGEQLLLSGRYILGYLNSLHAGGRP